MPPEIVADRPDLLGENPLWHAVEQALYRVDYLRGEVRRFDPATGRDETIYTGPKVSGFTLQADGSLLLLAEGARVVRWQDGVPTVLLEGFPGSEGMHFNDCIADPRGRVYTGTVPDDPDRYADRVGVLVRIDRDARVTPLVEGIGISNGLGFSPQADRLYFADTLSCRIDVFDYDVDSGNLSNRRLFVDLSAGPGRPDGLAVDHEGHVWSARWDGSAVHRYAPDGRLFISFRDTTHVSPTKGDWVGWIGHYEDIVKGTEGQYRVRIMDNKKGQDTTYPGVEVLPDGTFVTTTYGHWTEGEEAYVVSVRFNLAELDAKLGGK